MAARRPALGKILGDLDSNDFGDPVREILPFRDCATVAESRATLREQVSLEVAAMSSLLSDADAFDVIELVRMREFAVVPDPAAAPSGGSGLIVEIVGSLLLGREGRQPSSSQSQRAHPHEVIEELHQKCAKLARLANYRGFVEGELRTDEPLARLASEYQGAVLNIRNLQYDHIRDAHDQKLFGTRVVRDLMARHLGYTYEDVLAVRSAMTEISAERMTRLRDDSGNLMIKHRGVNPSDLPADVAAEFMTAMTSLMFLPGTRAVITPSEVAGASGLDEDVARKILVSFAQVFNASMSAEERVFNLLMGKNPFLASPLLSDGSDAFALTSGDIGLDALRRILERALPSNSADVRQYDKKARQFMSEELANQYLEKILGVPAALGGYFYWAPKSGESSLQLGRECSDVKKVADRVEGDALFIVDDVAFIVEVKGKSIADQARRGDVRRLTTDLKATVGDGAKQAARLRELLEANGGIWTDPGTWLDYSHVREIRSLVVLLDDVGPLGTNLEDLRLAGLVPEKSPPLVLSLHDLAVIAEVGERPSEFLLYVRRRTDSPVRTYYRAFDELDLYMLFLAADLYVEDDPDDVKRDHPTVPPVTDFRRREFHESAVGTLVTDNCAELNAWMVRDKLPEGSAPAKPSIDAPKKLLDIIDQLRSRERPGWLRCGADMLALSGKTQRKVLSAIEESARKARTDKENHDAALSFAGLWGHPALFIAAQPATEPHRESADRFQTYARTKQYQLQADRAYGWIFDQNNQLRSTFYLDSPPASDVNLDTLVSGHRLQPVGDRAKPIPPSARRSTKRLGGRPFKR